MKGGARNGAGRPKAAPSVVVRIRLPLEQHAAYLERGGDVWLKRLIAQQRVKTIAQSLDKRI